MGSNRKLVERTWEIFGGDLNQLDEVLSPRCEFRGPGGTMRGPDEIRPYVQAWFAAFPDLQQRISRVVEIGDTVALELVLEGTHTATMKTPEGEIPATGRRVRWDSMDYVRVSEGKIVSWHAYWDRISMLGQLGLL